MQVRLLLFSMFVSYPKLIKDFGYNFLNKVKSDKADVVKIASYAFDRWTYLKTYCLMD
ncbi:hypothetical protein [Anaerovorax odorimutans]|uniref:hypothetical protein n=1 Tax=Anaerovorax odorimutans TaxID=109327 RepID=UPI002E8E4F36|nr:hypothetical protein [Anaerovorax odorimutans]